MDYPFATMESPKISIIMEGTSENGNIPLSEFSRIIDAFLKLLKETEKSALKNNSRCNFMVSNISHSSPIHIEITPQSANSNVIIDSLLEQTRIIEAGEELPPKLSKKWGELAKYNENLVKNCEIRIPKRGNPIFLPKIKQSLTKKRTLIMEELPQFGEIRFPYHTSITGWVRTINLEKRQLRAYPRVLKWNSVDVHFPEKFESKVIKSVNKFTEISGMARHRAPDVLPYQMTMEAIRILPDEKDLPKLSDFEGKFPNITGGKTVQEYLDDRRKEWER